MKKRVTRWSIFIAFSALFSSQAAAQGGLLITPGRVVFDGTKRIEELNLANNGKDTARYQISLIDIKMNENGTFEQITIPDSGQYFANKNLRIFPRNILLAPNEAQSVKLQLINSNQLTPGEYRSHLYFRAVPLEVPLGEKTIVKDSGGISVKLVPIIGITIPVIIRIGETAASVDISDVSLTTTDDRKHHLNLVFNRTGNQSVYGHLRVNFISPEGKVTPVGQINGIAVYTPTARRKLIMVLDEKAQVDYKKGKLQVLYTTSTDARSSKIAETELALF